MKPPVKLVKDNDSIKGIFKFPLNFVEGSNSEGFPTTLFNTAWYQFPPEGLTEVRDDIMTLFVEWYNSRQETIEGFIDGEIDKLFLNTWDKEAALKYLTEKLEEYPYREK